MTKPARSDATIIPLDSRRPDANVTPGGKGRKEKPERPRKPEPPPAFGCLEALVELGSGPGQWFGIANIPGDEEGLNFFSRIIQEFPDDSFLESDLQCRLDFASIRALRQHKGMMIEFHVHPSSPDEARQRYPRLRLPTNRGYGEAVGVANVPWTMDGMNFFRDALFKRHRDCEFASDDHGLFPIKGCRISDLLMPENLCGPTPRKPLRPSEFLHPDDLTDE